MYLTVYLFFLFLDEENSKELIGGAKMAVKVADLSTHTWETGDEVIT